MNRTAIASVIAGMVILSIPPEAYADVAPSTVNPMTTDQTLVIAHRGLHQKHGENSIAGLKDAYRQGASCSDADARKTSDGKWIAYHDHSLDWKTNGTGEVASRTWSYIRTLRYDVDGSRVATLKQLVAQASKMGRYCLVMELPVVPTDEDIAYFTRLIENNRMTKRFVWYTANYRTASRLDPSVPVWNKAYQFPSVERMVESGFDGVIPRRDMLTEEFVADMRAANLRVVSLVSNRKAHWRTVKRLDLDGFMTDRIKPATRWFKRNG